MTKKSRKKERLIDQAGHAPDSLAALAREFIQSRKIQNYSQGTIQNHSHHLEYFLRWCHKRRIINPIDVSIETIEKYQKHLYYYRQENGLRLTTRTQLDRLCTLRVFFRWLVKKRHVIYNPTADIDLPKTGRTLPEQILTVNEVETILNEANLNDGIGIRDRAILETFYSTGIRRKELVGLRVRDIYMDKGIVMIRGGKGNKDRVVPIGERALKWLEKYIQDVRPYLLKPGREKDILFLTVKGDSFRPDGMTSRMSGYIRKAGIPKKGACHIFRHTAATLMLENGADLRYIQEMLGHSDMSTTEVYTRVSVRKLTEVHENTHPASEGANVKKESKA